MKRMTVLSVQGVTKTYGKNRVLNDVSIEVPKAKIFGLLGPNGAGKTTLIRIVNQIINSDKGEVIFNGEKLRREHIRNIGYLPEERGLYSKMQVGEHLLYMAQLRGFKGAEAREVIKGYLHEFDIASWWYKKVEQLSKGMQQKIQFIIAIMHQPELIILDEPFTGFDPVNTEVVKRKILDLREQGTTFILSTHRMDSVEELCDNIALINKANKILDGKKTEIKLQYKENIYELTTEQEPAPQLWTNEDFEYLGSKAEEGLQKLQFKLPEKYAVNDLLDKVMPHVQVQSVNEVIPSINDIFISLVKEKEHE